MLSAALYARVHFVLCYRTRDLGCSAHPVFPAPSHFEGKEFSGKARAYRAARMRSCVYRHCERSEAIHAAATTKCGLLCRFAPRNDAVRCLKSNLEQCVDGATRAPPQIKTRRNEPPRLKTLQRKTKKPYSSSSCFLPPIPFSFANTASTLRSSRCFSVGSNSGSFLVVSEAGSRVAPP